MPVTVHETTDDVLGLSARQFIAAALGLALNDPRLTPFASPPPTVPADAVLGAWDVLSSPLAGVQKPDLGLGEIPPAHANPRPLAEWLALPAGLRTRVFQQVYGLVVAKECPPFETEYYPSKDTFARSQQMADIAGFFAAFGLEPDASRPQRHDHVSLGLGFVAFLLEKLSLLATDPSLAAGAPESTAICRDALAHFIRDHAAWWMPTFARCLELRIDDMLARESDAELRAALGSLAGVARLLRAWVAAERINTGVDPSRRIVEPFVPTPEPDEDSCQSECSSCAPTGAIGT